MVREMVKLLQFDLLPVPAKENRSAHTATIEVEVGLPAKERKKPLYQSLVKRGVPRKQAADAVFSNNSRWALSAVRAVTRAYPNSWFINLKGQEVRFDQKMAHWFDVSQWVHLV